MEFCFLTQIVKIQSVGQCFKNNVNALIEAVE